MLSYKHAIQLNRRYYRYSMNSAPCNISCNSDEVFTKAVFMGLWVDLFDYVFYYRALYTCVCVLEPLEVSDLSEACVSPAQYLKYLGGLNEAQETKRAGLIGGQERSEINRVREVNTE